MCKGFYEWEHCTRCGRRVNVKRALGAAATILCDRKARGGKCEKISLNTNFGRKIKDIPFCDYCRADIRFVEQTHQVWLASQERAGERAGKE